MVKATSSVFIAAILAAPALGAGLDDLYERETVEQDIYGRNLASAGAKFVAHHHHHVEAAAEALNRREYMDIYRRNHEHQHQHQHQHQHDPSVSGGQHHHHHPHPPSVAPAPTSDDGSMRRREYVDVYRRNHEHQHQHQHQHDPSVSGGQHHHHHPHPPSVAPAPTSDDGSMRRRELEGYGGYHHDSVGVPQHGLHNGPLASHPYDHHALSGGSMYGQHHDHTLGALPGSSHHQSLGSVPYGAHHAYGAMGSMPAGPSSRPTAVQQALERFKSLIQKKQQDRLQAQHPHSHSGALMQRDLDGLLDERDLEDLNEVLAREYDEALYEREFGDEDLFEREFSELDELD